MPVNGGGNDQPGNANELEDAESRPGVSRQRAKGGLVSADLVEQEDLHDARSSVEERGEDLEHPQKEVHRCAFCRKTDPKSTRLDRMGPADRTEGTKVTKILILLFL